MDERIVFMGTPEFAVPSLLGLAQAGYAITVVTQPDRPAGRGGGLMPPPVKRAALELGLQVMQPPTLRDPAVIESLREVGPVAVVLVAYGELLRRSVLEMPPHGCLNLHPSLLPRWRGPTPINAAILAGDTQTGVSIIRMDTGMDSGPLLAQERADLYPDDTAATLGTRLAQQGADLLVNTLASQLRGEITPQPQPSEGITVCRLLSKEDGRLDWTAPADALERQVRAYDPWPGTYTTWGGRRLKVQAIRPLPADALPAASPGQVSLLPSGGVIVACGGGWSELLRVQLEGKPITDGPSFARGYPAFSRAVLE